LAQRGRYDQAVTRLNEISSDTLRTLKNQQLWTFFSGLLKLRRQLHRYCSQRLTNEALKLTTHRDNKVAADNLISQLQAGAPSDSELSVTLSLIKADLLIRRGDYTAALNVIEQIAQFTQQENFDVSIQVKLLNMKVRIFDKSGQPERGFSLAMRAASIAHRSRLLPGLWEAIGGVATILISFNEFEAAMNMLESIVPQVLECEDSYLTARTYSLLVDANMGLAGQARHDTARRKEQLARAVEFIDYAFAEFSSIEDLRGQCEMMAKRATIMHLSGDFVLANDCAAKYLDLKSQAATDL
jgi:anaphase-promoting complex subunit 5